MLLDLKQFVNHPEMSAMIRDQDKNMLCYMIDLQVRMGNEGL